MRSLELNAYCEPGGSGGERGEGGGGDSGGVEGGEGGAGGGEGGEGGEEGGGGIEGGSGSPGQLQPEQSQPIVVDTRAQFHRKEAQAASQQLAPLLSL